MHLIYTVSYGALLALALPYLLIRSLRETGYAASVVERLGARAPARSDTPSLWIHAVSVGEVLAAATLVPALKRAFPDKRVVCSVTTTTGRSLARDKLKDADEVFYCPFDLPVLVRRIVGRVRPSALLMVETEIWPGLIHEARRAGARTSVVNGRISDKSFPRYRRIRWFLTGVLKEIDLVLVQNELYRERFIAMGAEPERVRVTGSLKFDAGASGAAARPLALSEGRTVLVGGSTLEPEESLLLDAFERLRRSRPELRLLLILAPRHPRRFDEVATLARGRGLETVRRSRGERLGETTDVLVLDTLGELDGVYGLADVVFVGGSLAPWGGHNIIEPAARGRPVVFGPHMQNFLDIAKSFLDAEAAIQVEDGAALEAALGALLEDDALRSTLGRRALEVVERNRGARERTVEALRELVP